MFKIFQSKKIIYLAAIVIVTSSSTLMYDSPNTTKTSIVIEPGEGLKDSLGSQKAFLAAYDVLMSPRCMNCHPSGDIPLQGDDSQLHTQGVKRGEDGKGTYALRCSSCHQPKNIPGLNMPPGNPKWQLPPADMRMVFQGKTPRELAEQLKDPERNGHKTLQQLITHVTSDDLVLGGWNPGEGRTLPPMSHAAFAKQFKAWIDLGAYLPGE